MQKKLVWLSMIFIAAVGASGLAAQGPATELAPGQIWSIKAASPTTAKVVINRVERRITKSPRALAGSTRTILSQEHSPSLCAGRSGPRSRPARRRASLVPAQPHGPREAGDLVHGPCGT